MDPKKEIRITVKRDGVEEMDMFLKGSTTLESAIRNAGQTCAVSDGEGGSRFDAYRFVVMTLEIRSEGDRPTYSSNPIIWSPAGPAPGRPALGRIELCVCMQYKSINRSPNKVPSR